MSEQMSATGSLLPLFPFPTPPAADGEPDLARLREAQPVARVRLATGQAVWLATRYDDVRQVVSDSRFSRAANTAAGSPQLLPNLPSPDMIANMDPPHHTRVRRLIGKAFTVRTVDRLRPRIAGIVDGLIDRMAAQRPPVDLIASLAKPLPTTVMCTVLGVPIHEQDRLFTWVDIGMTAAELPPAAVAHAFDNVAGYLLELFERKRRRPEQDLLTALVEAHDGTDRLTGSELLWTTLALFGAGQDTTMNQLANSMVTLFRHPDQLARLVVQPDLIPAAVEELLRYVRFIATMFARIATEDVELGGVTIRAGEAVFPVNHSANRDSRVFDRPDDFQIDRPDAGAHVAFGYGIHYCVGAPLARTELQAAVGGLLTRFPTLRPAVALDELEWTEGRVVRGLRALPVTW